MLRAPASHQCGPGSILELDVKWIEFVVGSRPCSERFFSGYSSFPLSSKTNISKFKFDLDYCQALNLEDCANTPRVISVKYISLLTLVFNITFTPVDPLTPFFPGNPVGPRKPYQKKKKKTLR